MAHGHKFDVTKLERLKNPDRLATQNPETIWNVVAGEGVATVVDIGAGLGFFAIPFSRKIPHGKVYACDLSAEMLKHLGEEISAAGADNVVAVKTEEVAVPLDDGTADLVLMANLHHELHHPERTLLECLRLLAPGGRLAVIDWKPVETPSGPPLKVRVNPETLGDQLRAAGFADVVSHPVLPHHYVITSQKPPQR
ncbi:MAG: class I SAM-dependent methyltransferase [bacterium]